MSIKADIYHASGEKAVTAQITFQIIVILAQVRIGAVQGQYIVSAVMTVGYGAIVAVVYDLILIGDAGTGGGTKKM